MAPIPSFTLGIEEEFQVIDPQSRELKSHIHELFAEGEKRLKDEIKREMHDAVIEVGTPICQNIGEARREITRLRREIITLTRENGLWRFHFARSLPLILQGAESLARQRKPTRLEQAVFLLEEFAGRRVLPEDLNR